MDQDIYEFLVLFIGGGIIGSCIGDGTARFVGTLLGTAVIIYGANLD